MGRFSLRFARSLKIVGGCLILPLVLFLLFIVPFGPPVEVLASSTVLAMLGLAVLGVLLLGLGKIIAPNDPWFDAKEDSESHNPGGTEEGRELSPKQAGEGASSGCELTASALGGSDRSEGKLIRD
jgi:hypothetical protein